MRSNSALMNKFTSYKKRIKLSSVLAALALTSIVAFEMSCSKNKDASQAVTASHRTAPAATTASKSGTHQTLTSVATVAMLRTSQDGRLTKAMFNENEQILNVTDEAAITSLREAYNTNTPVQITFDPWAAVLVKVSAPSAQQIAETRSRQTTATPGISRKVDLAHTSSEIFDNPSAMGLMNTTDPGLTPVIPDIQTAQMMFDYITHQCCQLPGPYAIDHCLTFQYCQDGCYARAHKMCWIINNRYKYATQKIFSFANSGSDELCVQAQKWGGCCINWWYHVAPLVTVKTPTGPKAYVFDPAMFDQPVLLSAWLHAQENPVCAAGSDVAHVSMINIQPTASYWPSGSSGMTFGTDPVYSSTNSTLLDYQHLISCP